MRLYFHLVTDRETILDPEGVEVDMSMTSPKPCGHWTNWNENADATRGWSGWALNITTAAEVILRRSGTGPPDPVTGALASGALPAACGCSGFGEEPVSSDA